jgi:transposase-like protein
MKITTAQWRQHVAAWRDSGLSQAAYCREHGLNSKTLSWWTRKLASEDNTGATAGLPVAGAVATIMMPEFIPVSIKTPGVGTQDPADLADSRRQRQSAAAKSPAVPVTLRLPGAELALSTAVPPNWLAELLQCLA